LRVQRHGIATAALAVVIVIVIAVAGAAAYFALTSGSSPSSTTQTSSHSSASSTTAAQSSSTHSTSSQTQASTSQSSVATTPTTVTTTSSATQTSAATTLSTYSCTSTYTTGTSVDYTPQYIGLIKQYSSMEFKVSDNTNGTAQNSTMTYQVTSVSGSVYTANITLASGSDVESLVAEVDASSNTVQSVTISFSGFQQTVTGDQAKSYFDSFMGLFGLEITYSTESGVFTDSTYFHSAGTSTASFGTVSFPVTTWEANTLPFSLNDCGVIDTITAYTLQLGTPPGTSLTFVTYLHVATSSPNTEDVVFQLVSLTVA